MSITQKWFFLGVMAVVLLLDQGSKSWVIHHLHEGQAWSLGPYFNLRLAYNTGAAFSLFRQADGTISFLARWFLIVLALGVSVVLAYYVLIKPCTKLKAWSFSLIIAGAIGNVIDRLQQGFVTDFLDIHVQAWHYPTFNIADCAVVGGVLLLLLCNREKAL